MTVVLAVLLISCNTQPALKAPVADKIAHEVFEKRNDNYFWMRLSDEQKADSTNIQTRKVLDYLKQENEYAKEVLKGNSELQKTVYDEIVGRIKKDDKSVPYLENGYYYFNKYTEGTEYPVFYRFKATADANKVVQDRDPALLLDVNKLAAGKSYCSVNNLSVSKDNKILAYGVDYVSRRRYTLNFMDIGSGTLLPDKIENTTGEAVWAADNKTVFYVTKDQETLRSDKVFRHKIDRKSVV